MFIYAVGVDIGRGKRPLKVGTTTDIRKRITDLQVGCPLAHEVCGLWRAEPHTKETEWLFHLVFRDKRIRGEWFNVSIEEVRAFMARDASLDVARYGTQGSAGVPVPVPSLGCSGYLYKMPGAVVDGFFKIADAAKADLPQVRRPTKRKPAHQDVIAEIVSKHS